MADDGMGGAEGLATESRTGCFSTGLEALPPAAVAGAMDPPPWFLAELARTRCEQSSPPQSLTQ